MLFNLIIVQQDPTYSVYYISAGSSTCFGCCIIRQNFNITYITYIHIFFVVYFIFCWTYFKNTAFNHPPIFYTSYSSRLVTFNITNLEF